MNAEFDCIDGKLDHCVAVAVAELPALFSAPDLHELSAVIDGTDRDDREVRIFQEASAPEELVVAIIPGGEDGGVYPIKPPGLRRLLA